MLIVFIINSKFLNIKNKIKNFEREEEEEEEEEEEDNPNFIENDSFGKIVFFKFCQKSKLKRL